MGRWLTARPLRPRCRITVPAHGGAGFPEDPARPGRSYCFFHGREIIIDDLAQFSPGVRAVRDVLQQRECFSRDVQRRLRLTEVPGQFLVLRLEFLILRPQPGQLRSPGAFLVLFLLPARLQGPGGLRPPPVLQMRMVDALLPQQGAALRTALRQGAIRRQDPRLIRGGERPPLRPPRLPAAGHLTIMPRDRGPVSECHRHYLNGPVSPCFATEISYVPGVSCRSDREGAAATRPCSPQTEAACSWPCTGRASGLPAGLGASHLLRQRAGALGRGSLRSRPGSWRGVGRALMSADGRRAAASNCTLVALGRRQIAPDVLPASAATTVTFPGVGDEMSPRQAAQD